jgi:hypothetical protein
MKAISNFYALLATLFTTSLTSFQTSQLRLFKENVKDYILVLSDIVLDLYSESKYFLFSTNTNQCYNSFSDSVKDHLKILDYKNSISVHVHSVKNEFVFKTLKSNQPSINIIIEHHISEILEKVLIDRTAAEKNHISKCLAGETFFNLTDKQIPKCTLDYMAKGGKYNPYLIKSTRDNLLLFDSEFCKILNNLLRWVVPHRLLVSPTTLHSDVSAIKTYFINHDSSQNVKLIGKLIANFYSTRKQYKTDLIHNVYSDSSCDVSKHTLARYFDFDKNVMFVEGDKNVGFVCISKFDLLAQYTKINKEQCFAKVTINEDDYLRDIAAYIKDAERHLPRELSNIIPPRCFKHTISSPCLGTLRLMPKILKLKEISPKSIDTLKCRGIKSSMSDPIQVIQLALDHVFNHIIYFQEKEFAKRYGRNSPSVTGVDEALFRHKKSYTGFFGTSMEIEADFSNLYSFCEINLLKKHVEKGLKLANISDASKDYIFNLIEVEMTRSYFKEPTGIFQTLNGFSMGDHAAAHGSEVILLSCELDAYALLILERVISVVKEHERFRDDVKLHLSGDMDMMLFALKIIITSYPKEIQLNVKTGLITGNFLNLRIFNDPTMTHPYTTILRKQHSRYNIIPPHSNTVGTFKLCAGRTYARMAVTHCSTQNEFKRQQGIIRLILEKKGFSTALVNKMLSKKWKKQTSKTEKKRFIGTVTFDALTNNHKRLRSVFQLLSKDVYYLPMCVPDVKLKQFIFTLRKMKTKLGIA